MILQRDAFISEIVDAISNGEDIYFLSSDFGAAALDRLRMEFPNNFVHCGISEQNMIDVATGLALEGKKVFCYAMAPFLSMRALEQIKCGPGVMNLPICLISVGVGIGYADSGPTHYVTEEFACLRSIVGSNVYTASDSTTAKNIAKKLISSPEFAYVRLDRHYLKDIKPDSDDSDFRVIGSPSKGKVALVSHGRMLHLSRQVVAEHPEDFYAIDLIRSKPFPNKLVSLLGMHHADIIAIDEQTPSGAIGSALYEACSREDFFPRLINLTLPEKYFFENIGRDALLESSGLSVANILRQSRRFLR